MHELHIINRSRENYPEKPRELRESLIPTPVSIGRHTKYWYASAEYTQADHKERKKRRARQGG